MSLEIICQDESILELYFLHENSIDLVFREERGLGFAFRDKLFSILIFKKKVVPNSSSRFYTFFSINKQ